MWKKLLKTLRLIVHTMPRDVAIWWNLTFVMLDFALEYREAIDKFTSNQAMDVWNLKLDEEEWELAQQLYDILKVH